MNSQDPRTWIVAKVVIIGPDSKILTLRRSKTAPHHALTWDLPGGLIEFGEDPLRGLIRETKEESGLDIENPVPFAVTSDRPGGHYEISLYFLARSPHSSVTLSYEHDMAKWVTAAQFAQLDSAPGYGRAVERAAKIYRSDAV